MSATSWQNITFADLDQAVDQTFSLVADLPTESADSGGEHDREDMLMGVYCEEEQQRALIVRCGRPLASSLASCMLETPDGALSEVDRIDALGEIANIVAGTIRGLMQAPGAMSTPFRLNLDDLGRIPQCDQRAYRIAQQAFTLYLVR